MDVHGAGSQRSDPKTGNPMSRGPQGDMIRVKNYVRCVRGGLSSILTETINENINKYPDKKNKFQTGNQNGQKNPQPQQKRSIGANKFINQLDEDGDGKVSKSEFKGPPNRFSDFDKNNDGYISEEEAPTGPPAGRRRR